MSSHDLFTTGLAFPHNHILSLWCKFPSAFLLPPFLFSHRDHAAVRVTDIISFSPRGAGCEEEQSWLSFVNQEYPQHFLTNLVPSHIVFRGISRAFLITVLVYLSTKSVFSCDFFFFKLRGKEDLLLKKCLLYFPVVKCHCALCTL